MWTREPLRGPTLSDAGPQDLRTGGGEIGILFFAVEAAHSRVGLAPHIPV